MKLKLILLGLVFWPTHLIFCQFQTNSDAQPGVGACYILTPEDEGQTGTIWTLETIDFNAPFDTLIWVMAGGVDEGGDGLVFAFHTGNISLGSYNGHMAYEGLPSILGIEIDTHQNPEHGDPGFDHLAITRNGGLDHRSSENLAGPVAIAPDNSNIEDGKFHSLRIAWKPPNDLNVYWDCNLRLSYNGNVVNEIFNGNSIVRWGFTAGTSSVKNRHEICLASQPLNELTDQSICAGGQAQLRTTFIAEQYQWTPSESLDNPAIANPIARPTETTTYFLEAEDECKQVFTDTLTVFVEGDSLDLDFGGDTTLCHASELLIDAKVDGATYLWSNGSTNSTITVNESGVYSVSISTSNCEAIFSRRVLFSNPPIVHLGEDTTLCSDANSVLNAFVENGNYLWHDGSTAPEINVEKAGLYAVTVSNDCGQIDASVQVNLQECDLIYIPSAFSPNNDGLNDFFSIQTPLPLQIESFQVFDRWGNMVFSKKDLNANDLEPGWDGRFRGKPMPAGVFIYHLRFTKADGSTGFRSGEITLLK